MWLNLGKYVKEYLWQQHETKIAGLLFLNYVLLEVSFTDHDNKGDDINQIKTI